MTGDVRFSQGETAQTTVLIIEDDPGTIQVFEEILRLNGYGVCVATNAETGLAEVRRVNPSAILVDFHLPLADGVEFLREVRAAMPHTRIPVAVVTGDYFLDEPVAREIQSLGASVHFKPLWEDDLLALVRDLLRSEREMTEGRQPRSVPN